MKTSNSSGFTILEIIIAAAIFVVIVGVLLLGGGSSSRKTPARLDEIQALSHFRRLSQTLHKKVQASREVIIPPDSDRSSTFLTLRLRSGDIVQYFKDAEGSFLSRTLPADPANPPKRLLKLPSRALRIQSLQFSRSPDGSLHLHTRYSRQEGVEEHVLAEAFDSIHSPY